MALAFVAGVGLSSGDAQAVTDTDFIIDDLDDLVRVCTVPDQDPMHTAAINFCQGYLVGAFHTGVALKPPGKRPLVCLPKVHPTRTQAVASFMAWAQAHPQYGKSEAVEAFYKFLIEKWPCRS